MRRLGATRGRDALGGGIRCPGTVPVARCPRVRARLHVSPEGAHEVGELNVPCERRFDLRPDGLDSEERKRNEDRDCVGKRGRERERGRGGELFADVRSNSGRTERF